MSSLYCPHVTSSEILDPRVHKQFPCFMPEVHMTLPVGHGFLFPLAVCLGWRQSAGGGDVSQHHGHGM